MGLTFLYHSLQNIHVVFLRHSTECGELGLGDKLQKLEQRKQTVRETLHKFHPVNCRDSVPLPHYLMFVVVHSSKGTCTPKNKCCLEQNLGPLHLVITLK